MIISFPNRFEDGKGADPNLLRKLTTEEELSGIFNILVKVLGRVLESSIFVAAKTIEERRQKYQLAVDPITFFLNEAISFETVESDKITKDELYEAYKLFCKKHTLAVESKISFGRIIKGKGFEEYRESSGERRTMWKGIKLDEEYRIDKGQQQLSDLTP